MRLAIAEADRGIGRVHPNPLVGAVVVRDGIPISTGHHAEFGGEHAEAMALRIAGAAARGATLYVTLEPCNHHGKQPPCASAVIASGVTRVVVGVRDPNPIATGGIEQIAAAGIRVEVGVCQELVAEQNFRFWNALAAPARPWVAVKLATSIDGMIADHTGHSRWISGTPARMLVHQLRAGVAAVGVGAATAIADNAQLTVRGARTPAKPPLRVLFDRSGRLGADAPILTDGEGPVTVMLSTGAPESGRAELERVGARVHVVDGLPAAMNALLVDGVDSILIEGGGRLVSALLDAQLVDRLYLFQAPIWLGAGIPAWTRTSAPAMADVTRWRRRVVTFDDSDDLLQVMEPN
jgi:diaminohydroxyphosphoribosylaminopyrimidine deaminase / 5-amino-6-(5-phosphoribosylamino)uracil reductase